MSRACDPQGFFFFSTRFVSAGLAVQLLLAPEPLGGSYSLYPVALAGPKNLGS